MKPILHIGLNGQPYSWDEIESMSAVEKERYYNAFWDLGANHPNGLRCQLDLRVANTNEIILNASIENQSTEALFLMLSGANLYQHLRIRNLRTGRTLRIDQSFLASGINNGFVLDPGATQELSISGVNSNNADSWGPTVELLPGPHLAHFHVLIDENFSCTFSHNRFPELLNLAYDRHARLWQGNCISNVCEFSI